MMTPRTTITPRVSMPREESKAIYAANTEIRMKKLQAKIEQNREKYDALTDQEKQEFWFRGGFAPKVSAQGCYNGGNKKNVGLANRRLPDLTREAVLEFIGDGEKTATNICLALNPYRGWYAVREICSKAVADGILKTRKAGVVIRYSLVKK